MHKGHKEGISGDEDRAQKARLNLLTHLDQGILGNIMPVQILAKM